MADMKLPIQVGGTTPAIVEATARYAGAILAGWLIRRGYLTGADEPLVVGLALAIGAAAWGIYAARSNTKKLTTLEEHLPDSIVRRKKPRLP